MRKFHNVKMNGKVRKWATFFCKICKTAVYCEHMHSLIIIDLNSPHPVITSLLCCFTLMIYSYVVHAALSTPNQLMLHLFIGKATFTITLHVTNSLPSEHDLLIATEN